MVVFFNLVSIIRFISHCIGGDPPLCLSLIVFGGNPRFGFISHCIGGNPPFGLSLLVFGGYPRFVFISLYWC